MTSAGAPPSTGHVSGLGLDEVRVRFGELAAVDGVSLRLPPGDVLAVLGPSGCGKSTLLRAIAGLEPLAGGRITWEGADLARVPTYQRGFAMMFQDGQLFGHMSVARNVAYGLKLKGVRGAELSAEVDRLLSLVGLEGRGADVPATLSGGQQQRVALARALGACPRLLLLDEPLSALDRDLRERLALDLRTVLHDTSTTAVMVTHDRDEARVVADVVALMDHGKLTAFGAPEDVLGPR